MVLTETGAPAILEAVKSIQESVDQYLAAGYAMNEAMTESIIIDKLLPVLGYTEVLDIIKQGLTEGVGEFPDYTLLPKKPEQWILEVKKWKLPLSDKEASQTVKYASNLGNRWAVLTNGCEWRIYDAHSYKPLAAKCILTLKSLADPDAYEFFTLLSKSSIFDKQLEHTYRARLISAAVTRELTSEDSATIKALRKAVEVLEIPDVKKPEVLAAVQQLLNMTVMPAIPPCGTVTPPPPTPTPETKTMTLRELGSAPLATNHVPVTLILPGKDVIAVPGWRDVVYEVVQYIAENGKMPPIPYANGSSAHSDRYFINSSNTHSDGSIFVAAREFQYRGQTLYIYRTFAYAHPTAVIVGLRSSFFR